MKKHYAKAEGGIILGHPSDWIAACELPPKSRSDFLYLKEKNRRLTRQQVLANLDKGYVCKACKRIAVVERLNGDEPKPRYEGFATSTGRMSSASPNFQNIPKHSNGRSVPVTIVDEFAKVDVASLSKLMKELEPSDAEKFKVFSTPMQPSFLNPIEKLL